MSELPTGVVTFVMSDVEGSTSLWERAPEEMRAAAARLDAIVDDVVAGQGGVLVKPRGEGDSHFCVFARATDAVAAAVALQRALAAEPWPDRVTLRTRIALHTGEADRRADDYYGPVINRCARLRAIVHGGQTVISAATEQLARDALPGGVTLRDLGSHRLKDLARDEQVFQVCAADLPADFPPLRSLDLFPTNLPVQATAFVGRDREVEELRALVAEQRLVTVAGPGGSGKTRLALQVAADLSEEHPDGVWLVELAALSDAALVAQQAASAIGVREQPGRAIGDSLIEHLAGQRALVLLDNCEHVVGACAALAETLLARCPGVRILATSQEPLAIGGEAVFRLDTMAVPPERARADELEGFESVRLFVDRARLAKPGFSLSGDNAAAVAAICRRLEGIPFAIELAAARVASLAPQQIADRLADRFRILTSGARTALPRRQTLRATVEWSYELVPEIERRLLHRLAAFAGGFTLEAAEAICAGDGIEDFEVLDALSSLVGRSLVQMEERDAGVRYRLLETIREYAGEKLEGEAEPLRARHAGWYADLAERAGREMYGGEQAAWLDRLDAEIDNLRAALRHGLDEPAIGWRLVDRLAEFWRVRGYPSEARSWLERMLERHADAPPDVRASALVDAGAFAVMCGDHRAAADLLERGLSEARAAGVSSAEAGALTNLGALMVAEARLTEGRALYEEALRIERSRGSRRSRRRISDLLNNLGVIALEQGDLVDARSLFEEGLAESRALGNASGVADTLSNLGVVAERMGDLPRARDLFAEGLQLKETLGDRKGMASSLVALGGVARETGDLATAKDLLDRALLMHADLDDPFGLSEGLHVRGTVAVEEGAAEGGDLLLRALGLRRDQNDPIGMADTLDAIASVLSSSGDMVGATQALGAADAIRAEAGVALPASHVVRRERQVIELRDALGDERYLEEAGRGRSDPERVIRDALNGTLGS